MLPLNSLRILSLEKSLLSILFHIEPVNPMIIGSLVTTQHDTPLEGVFTFVLSVIPTSHSSAAPQREVVSLWMWKATMTKRNRHSLFNITHLYFICVHWQPPPPSYNVPGFRQRRPPSTWTLKAEATPVLLLWQSLLVSAVISPIWLIQLISCPVSAADSKQSYWNDWGVSIEPATYLKFFQNYRFAYLQLGLYILGHVHHFGSIYHHNGHEIKQSRYADFQL